MGAQVWKHVPDLQEPLLNAELWQMLPSAAFVKAQVPSTLLLATRHPVDTQFALHVPDLQVPTVVNRVLWHCEPSAEFAYWHGDALLTTVWQLIEGHVGAAVEVVVEVVVVEVVVLAVQTPDTQDATAPEVSTHCEPSATFAYEQVPAVV